MNNKNAGGKLIKKVMALKTACLFASSAMAGSFECLIVPNQVVEVRSQSEGLINQILVKRGDVVKRGQILVQLESSVEQTAVEMAKYRSVMEGRVAAAKARLEYAEGKLKRSSTLAKQNYVSAQANDEVEAERRIAKAELQDAQESLELAKYEYRHASNLLNRRAIRSPFDGVVVDRMLNPGDLAEVGTSRKGILKLAQIDPLKVEVALPQEAFGRVKVGNQVSVTPEGGRGNFNAQVTVVDALVDAASATYGVRLEMKNAAGKVPAGLRCRVDFPGIEPKTKLR